MTTAVFATGTVQSFAQDLGGEEFIFHILSCSVSVTHSTCVCARKHMGLLPLPPVGLALYLA